MQHADHSVRQTSTIDLDSLAFVSFERVGQTVRAGFSVRVSSPTDAGEAWFHVIDEGFDVRVRWGSVGAQHLPDFRPSREALRELGRRARAEVDRRA